MQARGSLTARENRLAADALTLFTRRTEWLQSVCTAIAAQHEQWSEYIQAAQRGAALGDVAVAKAYSTFPLQFESLKQLPLLAPPPRDVACVFVFPDESVETYSEALGKVFDPSPCASQCSADGGGLSSATVGASAEFTVRLHTEDGQPCPEAKVDVQVSCGGRSALLPRLTAREGAAPAWDAHSDVVEWLALGGAHR